ncbi:TetR/AcrR family transcriptional regulator [Haliea sp. E17]|uniref:TetR/AcrR family transcriptional regulator n=1 Tax=Haliea sp. E17 TaxID=3401576 RepID=UPI003AACDD25
MEQQEIREIELVAKQLPRQARAKKTYETILASAAELLVEVGVERISTNLIAERAGVTVPALYRYFPNKYAVIHALGVDLMQRQNSAFQCWMSGVVSEHGLGGLLPRVGEGLGVIYQTTREDPAGIEVFNALRAMAPLREHRASSRRNAARYLVQMMAQWLAIDVTPQLEVQARLTVDMACGIVESALESDPREAQAILQEGAVMIAAYWQQNYAQSTGNPARATTT